VAPCWGCGTHLYLNVACIDNFCAYLEQEVTFKVDYVVPSINREFGTVILNGNNVALDVVSDGWAKVTFFLFL
jgi:hypothetical protein